MPRKKAVKKEVADPQVLPATSEKVIKKVPKSQYQCFTVYNTEGHPYAIEKFEQTFNLLSVYDDVRYMVYQVEETTTDKLHIQGYVEYKSTQSLSRTNNIFSNKEIHVEKMCTTRDYARGYCKKEESRIRGPYEYGRWIKGQGYRTDLECYRDAIYKGASVMYLAEYHLPCLAKYPKLYTMLKQEDKPRTEFDGIEIYYGPSGTGKSTAARARYPDAYYKNSNNKWWSEYEGQEVVILDEYKGQIPLLELLSICDGYEYQVEVKNGHRQLKAKKVIITSNYKPSEWYPAESQYSLQPLLRRIKSVEHFKTVYVKIKTEAELFEDRAEPSDPPKGRNTPHDSRAITLSRDLPPSRSCNTRLLHNTHTTQTLDKTLDHEDKPNPVNEEIRRIQLLQKFSSITKSGKG